MYQRRTVLLNIVFDLTTGSTSGPKNVVIDLEGTGKLLEEAHIFLFAEPVFLNVYGAQVSIPRNEFRQPYVL
jgi:hypothetical protein